MKWLAFLPLILLMACVTAKAQDPNTGVLLGVAGGRFVLGQTSGAARDTFLLDTQTGRCWQMVVDPKTQKRHFTPVVYSLLNGGVTLHAPEPKDDLDGVPVMPNAANQPVASPQTPKKSP